MTGSERTARLEAAWLHAAPLRDLLAALDRDGEQARVVGGAVRNTLLGEPPGDIDIATTAVPDEVVRRVRATGFKPVPTGIEHGTITAVAAGRPFEITTLREDVDLRATCQGCLRPQLETRCRASRLHHERAVGRARRHGLRLCRGTWRHRGPACAVHRRRRDPHRRGLSARAAVLPLPRRLRRGCPGRGGYRRLSPLAAHSRNCRASVCAWRWSSSCSPGARCRRWS